MFNFERTSNTQTVVATDLGQKLGGSAIERVILDEHGTYEDSEGRKQLLADLGDDEQFVRLTFPRQAVSVEQ